MPDLSPEVSRTCTRISHADVHHCAAVALDAAEQRIRQLEDSLHRKPQQQQPHGVPLSSPSRLAPPPPPPPPPLPTTDSNPVQHPLGPPPPARAFSPAEEAEVRRLRELREQSELRCRDAEISIQRHEAHLSASREQQRLLERLGALRDTASPTHAPTLESERTRLLLFSQSLDSPKPPPPPPPPAPPLSAPPPPQQLPPANPPAHSIINPPSSPHALSPARRHAAAAVPLTDPTMEQAVKARVNELINRARLKHQCGIETPFQPPQTSYDPFAPPTSTATPTEPPSSQRLQRPLSPHVGPSPFQTERSREREMLAGEGMLEVLRAGVAGGGPDGGSGWLAWHRLGCADRAEGEGEEGGAARSGSGSAAS
eukprot:TRINITY_DN7785_c2_g1_i1.p1 TRINITY_DN7785_c2_g1~~TRINITY_DN7785_c2_g1_i1.p1  ORF type:complete len:388 (+),score=122.97 TRINITY_DN7785_c2_g1_i1:56-1165(+)